MRGSALRPQWASKPAMAHLPILASSSHDVAKRQHPSDALHLFAISPRSRSPSLHHIINRHQRFQPLSMHSSQGLIRTKTFLATSHQQAHQRYLECYYQPQHLFGSQCKCSCEQLTSGNTSTTPMQGDNDDGSQVANHDGSDMTTRAAGCSIFIKFLLLNTSFLTQSECCICFDHAQSHKKLFPSSGSVTSPFVVMSSPSLKFLECLNNFRFLITTNIFFVRKNCGMVIGSTL